LGFITTDAAIDAKALQAALQEAVANSFNRITVDGDMSTNDTVLVLAKFEGLSYREIAEVMGITESAVESRLFRAMQRVAGAREEGG